MVWDIPFFGLAREFGEHQDEILSQVKSVYTSGQVLQGADVHLLEEEMADLCARRYAVTVGSCTDALYFSLIAAGIGPGDEVLVPDYSFIASASCILRAGAKPVFVDIGDDGNMDLAKAEVAVTAATRGIIYVHLYGLMGEACAVELFAKKHDLVLVEDAAQAIGACRKGRCAGSVGDFSCISFDPTKPLGAPGSGGIILTDDEEKFLHLCQLRYHGRNQKQQFTCLGYNSQMPSATAAILRYKLRYAKEWEERRHHVASHYIDGLTDTECLLPIESESTQHIYHKFVIRHPARDSIREMLHDNGVQCMVHYPHPLHAHELFKNYAVGVVSPVATAYAKSALSLPCHPFLTTVEVDNVISLIREVIGKS